MYENAKEAKKMSKKLYPYYLVLVGPGNGLEHEFTIKVK